MDLGSRCRVAICRLGCFCCCGGRGWRWLCMLLQLGLQGSSPHSMLQCQWQLRPQWKAICTGASTWCNICSCCSVQSCLLHVVPAHVHIELLAVAGLIWSMYAGMHQACTSMQMGQSHIAISCRSAVPTHQTLASLQASLASTLVKSAESLLIAYNERMD